MIFWVPLSWESPASRGCSFGFLYMGKIIKWGIHRKGGLLTIKCSFPECCLRELTEYTTRKSSWLEINLVLCIDTAGIISDGAALFLICPSLISQKWPNLTSSFTVYLSLLILSPLSCTHCGTPTFAPTQLEPPPLPLRPFFFLIYFQVTKCS